MNRLIIGVGSNIDPETHIANARSLLIAGHSLLAESEFVMTEPIGITDQPAFMNGAFLMETEFDREAFETFLKEIEDQLGRDRTAPRFGPRTIDLDIVT